MDGGRVAVDAAKPAPEQLSIEQLRAAFENGSPTVVCERLLPFLRLESRSNGDMRVINEISESVSKLLYPWFQNSESMRGDEQRSLYTLLRPDGLLIDTLLQYHVLQRERGATLGGLDYSQPMAAGLTLGVECLPVEYHSGAGLAAGSGMSLPADLAKRLVMDSSQGRPKPVGFTVNALECFLYHLCKALVPPRESATNATRSAAIYPPKSPVARHGSIVPGSVVYCIAREYIGFFLPVVVPEAPPAPRSDAASERSPIRQIRNRLHDLSPKKPASGNMAGDSAEYRSARKPGVVDADLLDVCTYGSSLELAGYFTACVALLWLPVVPLDIHTSVRATLTAGSSCGNRHEENKYLHTPRDARPVQTKPTEASSWVWIPSSSHLSALNLFHLFVAYIAKGERQMERFHLTGAMAPPATGSGRSGRAGAVDEKEYEAYEKRVGMNGTIRNTLRSRSLTRPIADTLAMVLASCGRTGSADTDIWIPFLDVMASIWIRYTMPWRGSKNDAPGVDARGGASSSDISPIWQSRIPLMVKGLPPVLYGQTFALFLKQVASPHIDLLAHTALPVEERQGHLGPVDRLAGGRRGPSSPSGGGGMQSWIQGTVNSVFGQPHTMDALSVVERVVSAFTNPELRAILAAIERCQLEAFPKLRSHVVDDPARPSTETSAGIPVDAAMGTPTRAPHTRPLEEDNRNDAKEDLFFERQIASAQKQLVAYAQEIVSFRSGSALLDAVVTGAFGSPPLCIVFGRPPGGALRAVVGALHGAELLAERQLRLIVPERSSDQARSLVADIFLVLSRVFSATDADSSRPGDWSSGAGGAAGGSETMRARAQSLQEAQRRIGTLYARLAAVFYSTRREIEAIKQSLDDAMVSAATPASISGGRAGVFASGSDLDGRSSSDGVFGPDMAHGALTPRGRWELKTGRKKFSTQSLLASPQRTPASNDEQMLQPPEWGLRVRSQSLDGGRSPRLVRGTEDQDAALLPRGPRAHYEARSYESQWLLDRILWFNGWINERYQQALDLLESAAYPIPAWMRNYKLDFRWAAAYQNIRFFALLLAVYWVVASLFF
ncbi:hypothetical protein GQ54DRAFT_308048 [Martensiomyces pterosporus]|nr:hypothetical protein GQ54DRAFT_308048 [Martensiomyces pterosporus]